MNKNYLIIAVIIGIIIVVGISLLPQTPNEKTQISVRFPIPIYEASETPFFVAQDLNYYTDEGLDVTFNFGSPEANPVSMVALGSDELGILGGPDTLINAISKGNEFKALAVMHENANLAGIITLKESGLERITDLEGKKIGFFYGHISTDILRALFHKENITVHEVDVGFDYSQLISKKIDGQWAFISTAGYSLEQKGVEINFIPASDYGINSHGWTIFAKEEYIQKNPEVVEKFLRATFKGMEYTKKNPEKAIESLLSRDVKLDKPLELKRLNLYNSATSTQPFGKMTQEMFDETTQRLFEEGIISEFIPAEEIFDASFINKINERD